MAEPTTRAASWIPGTRNIKATSGFSSKLAYDRRVDSLEGRRTLCRIQLSTKDPERLHELHKKMEEGSYPVKYGFTMENGEQRVSVFTPRDDLADEMFPRD